MAEVEEEIEAAGAAIIWVLEQDARANPGTAETCRSTIDGFGSNAGYCVGDGQTQPTAGVFDESPFAIARGFDMIVDTDTMVITWVTTHGTTTGNENLSGADVLAEVKRQTGR